MRFKFVILTAFIIISSVSFGQEFKNDLTSVKTIDNQIQDEQFSIDQMSDRLVVKTSIDKQNQDFYSKKEWKKIKKQLRKNRKKFSNKGNNIHSYKVIDTIYLNIPNRRSNQSSRTRLSAW
ncbi:hypothetical protein [Aquimarina algicola]|uniref:Uncharacterized protein n=1 Tax=Aquimarina algicola TaxID=2589995 RepID=A0A504JDY6_9FLAO|nr:hypothetical protein [Aquimarina algicola]TPN85918.1 hypothetical protein FHK87_11595 [Aquimarina algicola]